ncbi:MULTISPECIES: glycerate kinase [unclassified Cobetia]|uniref:glycerate kinase n=1 Tax=unclassified Cobetia TaxID=2609414 RepID=UPI0020979101|nr:MULTISPECIES: glycerate kinase [unclassified Cobetia]MCO7231029.1 glycerate kinase [Cobetia sp. Dlab-2-AX]MCO7234563.1 glycerate kinase [Cobetia sp. Dlab-2-U]
MTVSAAAVSASSGSSNSAGAPRLLIAPDSFKEALAASDAAEAMARGVRRVLPEAQIDLCPLGDGGEGTLAALLAAASEADPIEARSAQVRDPLGRDVTAQWGWQPGSRTAIVELAEASGLHLVSPEERDARVADTHGVGELILAALDAGAERLIVTLGGSATNDGGSGMLRALGLRLLDADGNELPAGGAALARLASLDVSALDPRLADLKVSAAVDVDNPLCGPRGASAVFGPQKGADAAVVEELDAALAHFARLSAEVLGADQQQLAGAGAAGGMGFAVAAWLHGELRPGIELVMERLKVSERLVGCDLLITGEGGLDGQSLGGKTPIGAARAARVAGVPAIVLAGRLAEGWQAAHDEGVSAVFTLCDSAMPLEQALARTSELLADRCEAIMRLWQLAQPD